jgi:endonuclease-3
VGEKTAKVVLYVLYKQRRVAVDTHVHRVMNRLAVVDTKTPEQTSKLLEDIIPDNYKDIAHHTIIYFGRYLCIARKPQCERCPLTRMCKWYKENRKEKKIRE